jgi:Rrf2 family transcriptional regulator, nitric oxide-sensitive transcriptional repressor
MQLTTHTDYALRILVYLALHQNQLTTISELADYFKISRNHLVKVVHYMGIKGFIKTQRGKNGGISLAKPPEQINIGTIVRECENNFYIVECFNPHKQGHCSIQKQCGLTAIFGRALESYLEVLDRASLKDVALLNGV